MALSWSLNIIFHKGIALPRLGRKVNKWLKRLISERDPDLHSAQDVGPSVPSPKANETDPGLSWCI